MHGGPIGPENPGEFLGPYALCSVQAFAQAVEDSTITDLSLTIALRITGLGESVGILYLEQKRAIFLLTNFVPLSEIMVWGSPK